MKTNGSVGSSATNLREGQSTRPSSRLTVLTSDNAGPALEAMLSCMENLDQRARLLIARDGTVLASGCNLQEWLQRSECLVLNSPRLQAIGADSQAKLARLFEVGPGKIATQIMNRQPSQGHCIVRASGLCEEAIALTMQLADEGFEPKLADLEEAFGLTPAEMNVVEMLHQGCGANDIGSNLGISVHTVRAHLRHCYDKLGVTSREGLWQRLAPYRLN
jgi:DNA-binding CsgD family transcriptional regulator